MGKTDFVYGEGIWYGPVSQEMGREDYFVKLKQANSTYEKIGAVIELLKLGDFSAKTKLIQLMEGADRKNRDLCVRVFCEVCDHLDISLLFKELDVSDGEDVYAFSLNATHTLSLHVLPHLLALLDIYRHTDLQETIEESINILSPITFEDGADPEEIEDLFSGITEKVDHSMYYFYNRPAFAGDMTKELIRRALYTKQHPGTILGSAPWLLSRWSGRECPVGFFADIDDNVMEEIYAYVMEIASMKWIKGGKYFYGHCISDGKTPVIYE